jgi:HAE1 family hydrophobic/amphiphilic exporter-1
MTAMTTVLGLVPLALGLGEGGEAQAPLARAVIGGLLSSTLITLVFVPTIYSIFERRLAKRDSREGLIQSSQPTGEGGAAVPPSGSTND